MRQLLADRLAAVEQRLQSALGRMPETLNLVAGELGGPRSDAGARIAREAERLREIAKAVDAELVGIVACQPPVAGDLRLVLALLQLAHHSMLIANQLGLIVEQLPGIDPVMSDRAATSAGLQTMVALASRQLRDALIAFDARDFALACALEAQDDGIDQINRRIFRAALELDRGRPERELAMRHVLISRSIERIGDNAVDIGEHAKFLVTAKLHEFNDASRPRPCRARNSSTTSDERPRD